MKAAGNSCKQELLDLVMEMFSVLSFSIHVRTYFHRWTAQHLTVLLSSAVGILSVRNFHLGCNSYTSLWQLFMSGGGECLCHSLARSSKHSSAHDAVHNYLLSLSPNRILVTCARPLRPERPWSLAPLFFSSLQHVRTARNAIANTPPSHLGVTSLAQLIQS